MIGVISIIAQLTFLEGILSLDNAAVLGTLVSILPADKPVPYPRSFHFLQGVTGRFLGKQQTAALKIGLLFAYLGRALMLLLAEVIRHSVIVETVGAVYLLKLALSHLKLPAETTSQHSSAAVRSPQQTFWWVVLHVELADLAFSLDNVIAAVSLSRNLWVVILGVAIGILLMRFAAGVFTRLVQQEPILATAAYLIVLNIGLELLLAEFAHITLAPWQKLLISAATILLCIGYARLPFLHHHLAPIFHQIGIGLRYLDGGVNRVLHPTSHYARQLFKRIRQGKHPLV